jgi:hypothetical protein
MTEGEYEEVFYPGNRALVSDQHDELVRSLKELNDRLAGITRQERAILKMAIDLLDYMKEYALEPENGEAADLDEQEILRRVREADFKHPPSFTVEEFLNDLICSGGLELLDGRCVPRW